MADTHEKQNNIQNKNIAYIIFTDSKKNPKETILDSICLLNEKKGSLAKKEKDYGFYFYDEGESAAYITDSYNQENDHFIKAIKERPGKEFVQILFNMYLKEINDKPPVIIINDNTKKEEIFEKIKNKEFDTLRLSYSPNSCL